MKRLFIILFLLGFGIIKSMEETVPASGDEVRYATIFDAIYAHNLEAVRQFVDSDRVDVNQFDESGFSLYEVARDQAQIRSDNSIFDYLVDRGAIEPVPEEAFPPGFCEVEDENPVTEALTREQLHLGAFKGSQGL